MITGDDKYAVTSSYDKTVKIWNLQEKICESVLEGHSGEMLSIVVTRDRRFLATECTR